MKVLIIIGGILLLVLSFLLISTLPAVGFARNFKSAIEAKDVSVIEKYFTSPLELTTKDGWVWVEDSSPGTEDVMAYTLFAYDSEYTVSLRSYSIDDFSNVILHFEAQRERPDGSGGILFYNVRIKRNGLSWIVSSYETDI